MLYLQCNWHTEHHILLLLVPRSMFTGTTSASSNNTFSLFLAPAIHVKLLRSLDFLLFMWALLLTWPSSPRNPEWTPPRPEQIRLSLLINIMRLFARLTSSHPRVHPPPQSSLSVLALEQTIQNGRKLCTRQYCLSHNNKCGALCSPQITTVIFALCHRRPNWQYIWHLAGNKIFEHTQNFQWWCGRLCRDHFSLRKSPWWNNQRPQTTMQFLIFNDVKLNTSDNFVMNVKKTNPLILLYY
jgi:hypothetical protein